MTERTATSEVEVSTEDRDNFDVVYAELRGIPGIVVQVVAPPVTPGEQKSVVEQPTAACSGAALTVFLEVIKTLVQTRGPGFILKFRRGKDQREITAHNVDDALPLLKALLDGQ
jgi:hypothetical protein